jgi:hypothetical protein
VNSADNLKFSNRWTDAKTFYSQGRLINKKNEYVKVTYPGSLYRVIAKKERAFTLSERIMRFTQFIFFSLLTLGLCNLKKSYRQLITKDKFVCRYAVRFEAKNLSDSNNASKFGIKTDKNAVEKDPETENSSPISKLDKDLIA